MSCEENPMIILDISELELSESPVSYYGSDSEWTRRCANCQKHDGKEEKFKTCSRCQQIGVSKHEPLFHYYCSRNCQKKHWSEHRLEHAKYENYWQIIMTNDGKIIRNNADENSNFPQNDVGVTSKPRNSKSSKKTSRKLQKSKKLKKEVVEVIINKTCKDHVNCTEPSCDASEIIEESHITPPTVVGSGSGKTVSELESIAKGIITDSRKRISSTKNGSSSESKAIGSSSESKAFGSSSESKAIGSSSESKAIGSSSKSKAITTVSEIGAGARNDISDEEEKNATAQRDAIALMTNIGELSEFNGEPFDKTGMLKEVLKKTQTKTDFVTSLLNDKQNKNHGKKNNRQSDNLSSFLLKTYMEETEGRVPSNKLYQKTRKLKKNIEVFKRAILLGEDPDYVPTPRNIANYREPEEEEWIDFLPMEVLRMSEYGSRSERLIDDLSCYFSSKTPEYVEYEGLYRRQFYLKCNPLYACNKPVEVSIFKNKEIKSDDPDVISEIPIHFYVYRRIPLEFNGPLELRDEPEMSEELKELSARTRRSVSPAAYASDTLLGNLGMLDTNAMMMTDPRSGNLRKLKQKELAKLMKYNKNSHIKFKVYSKSSDKHGSAASEAPDGLQLLDSWSHPGGFSTLKEITDLVDYKNRGGPLPITHDSSKKGKRIKGRPTNTTRSRKKGRNSGNGNLASITSTSNAASNSSSMSKNESNFKMCIVDEPAFRYVHPTAIPGAKFKVLNSDKEFGDICSDESMGLVLNAPSLDVTSFVSPCGTPIENGADHSMSLVPFSSDRNEKDEKNKLVATSRKRRKYIRLRPGGIFTYVIVINDIFRVYTGFYAIARPDPYIYRTDKLALF